MTWLHISRSLQLAEEMRKIAALGLAAVLGTAAAGSVTLTDSNFDTEVFDSGKNAFIKFQAPWCFPCSKH